MINISYSLTRSDVNGGTAVNLGNILSENVKKSATLVITPEPFGNSIDTRAIDFGGTTRTITLTGIINNNTPATLYSNAQNLLAFVNGNQSTAQYVSDMLGSSNTFNVKITDSDITFNAGETTMINYTITMVEASTDI